LCRRDLGEQVQYFRLQPIRTVGVEHPRDYRGTGFPGLRLRPPQIALPSPHHHFLVCSSKLGRPHYDQPVEGKTGAQLAHPPRWPNSVRPLPPLLQTARRAARSLLRARPARRPDGAHHLWPLVRLLHRSDAWEYQGFHAAGMEQGGC
jgi:hypothetical protein